MSVSDTYTIAPAANARPKASMRAFGALVVNTSSPPSPVARPAAVVTDSANRTSLVNSSNMPVQFQGTGITPTMAAPATGACYPITPPRRHRPPAKVAPRPKGRSAESLGEHFLELALVGGETADAVGQLLGGHCVLVVLPAEVRLPQRGRRLDALALVHQPALDQRVGGLQLAQQLRRDRQ